MSLKVSQPVPGTQAPHKIHFLSLNINSQGVPLKLCFFQHWVLHLEPKEEGLHPVNRRQAGRKIGSRNPGKQGSGSLAMQRFPLCS